LPSELVHATLGEIACQHSRFKDRIGIEEVVTRSAGRGLPRGVVIFAGRLQLAMDSANLRMLVGVAERTVLGELLRERANLR
jgi:hypothetical protein